MPSHSNAPSPSRRATSESLSPHTSVSTSLVSAPRAGAGPTVLVRRLLRPLNRETQRQDRAEARLLDRSERVVPLQLCILDEFLDGGHDGHPMTGRRQRRQRILLRESPRAPRSPLKYSPPGPGRTLPAPLRLSLQEVRQGAIFRLAVRWTWLYSPAAGCPSFPVSTLVVASQAMVAATSCPDTSKWPPLPVFARRTRPETTAKASKHSHSGIELPAVERRKSRDRRGQCRQAAKRSEDRCVPQRSLPALRIVLWPNRRPSPDPDAPGARTE